jgi:hypothetical protein
MDPYSLDESGNGGDLISAPDFDLSGRRISALAYAVEAGLVVFLQEIGHV